MYGAISILSVPLTLSHLLRSLLGGFHLQHALPKLLLQTLIVNLDHVVLTRHDDQSLGVTSHYQDAVYSLGLLLSLLEDSPVLLSADHAEGAR